MKPKSRKEEYAEMTRQALLDSALKLFIKKGFGKTTIEDIVKKARVTRGALYHHFKSKEEIFIVVYEGLVSQLVNVIEKAIKDIPDPFEKAVAGCKAFLDYCIDPSFKAIRLDVAIGVLGWDRWREIDSFYTMKLLRDLLKDMKKSGNLNIESVDYGANLIYAILVESALTIASATDKARAHSKIYEIIIKILTGLKS